jgi:addiction module HigA family antidote
MNSKSTAIPRDLLKIPKPVSNPAASVIRDTLDHQGISQVAAAKAMNISTTQLSDIIRQRKGVSAAVAIRFQFCFGVPADFLVRLQAQYDFQKALHSNGPGIGLEVTTLVAGA